MKEIQANITNKDHKEKFSHVKSFRLINPTKSEIGKFSKNIVDKINKNTRNATKVNQWKNIKEVINWFNGIKRKLNCTFITFDVESFYPSIYCVLFKKAILFVKQYGGIADQEVTIIMQARKTFNFHDDLPWIKKEGKEDFDIPMGRFDGAEYCELVGSYKINTHELNSPSYHHQPAMKVSYSKTTETSSNRDIFMKNKTEYENALKDRGFST